MNKPYETSDLYTICVCVAMGFQVQKVLPDPNNLRLKLVQFEDTEVLRKAILDHHNGELKISTRDLINAIETTKRLIR